ncbi:MAG: hypothetical protein ABI832_05025 [bacterium]
MNSLPILALGLVVSGYSYATAQLNDHTIRTPETQIIAYSAQKTDDVLADAQDSLSAPRCDLADELAGTLEGDFQENVVNTSLQADGLVMDLYASPDQGTWTLVHRGTDGISCVVSSGTGWTTQSMPQDVLAKVDLAT